MEKEVENRLEQRVIENGFKKKKKANQPQLNTWKWLFITYAVKDTMSLFQDDSHSSVDRASSSSSSCEKKHRSLLLAEKAEMPQSWSSTTTSSMNKFLLPHKCLPSPSFWLTVYSSAYLLSLEETRETHSLCAFWHYWEHMESKT